MAEENAFTRILNRLDTASSGVSEKTASDNTPKAPPNSEANLLQTVQAITKNASSKTASARTQEQPKSRLELMAKEAQDSENAQMLKQAQFMGAALADGFMERFAQYDSALSQQGIKTAHAAPALNEETLQKVAEAAYSKAVQDLEKKAAVDFDNGFNDQLNAVHKVAADVHYIGQQTAAHIIAEARKS